MWTEGRARSSITSEKAPSEQNGTPLLSTTPQLIKESPKCSKFIYTQDGKAPLVEEECLISNSKNNNELLDSFARKTERMFIVMVGNRGLVKTFIDYLSNNTTFYSQLLCGIILNV